MNLKPLEAFRDGNSDCADLAQRFARQQTVKLSSQPPNWAWAAGNQDYDWMDFHVPPLNAGRTAIRVVCGHDTWAARCAFPSLASFGSRSAYSRRFFCNAIAIPLKGSMLKAKR